MGVSFCTPGTNEDFRLVSDYTPNPQKYRRKTLIDKKVTPKIRPSLVNQNTQSVSQNPLPQSVRPSLRSRRPNLSQSVSQSDPVPGRAIPVPSSFSQTHKSPSVNQSDHPYP